MWHRVGRYDPEEFELGKVGDDVVKGVFGREVDVNPGCVELIDRRRLFDVTFCVENDVRRGFASYINTL